MKKYSKKINHKKIKGQILTEYIIMLAILTLIALSCIVLFSTFSEHHGNVRQQIGIDMP